jgi:hypothetical protein
MALTQSIRSASHVRDEFNRYGRKDQFTYHAYDALFDYYNELGDDTGQPIEFDVVAICCEWTEYDSLRELAEAYGLDVPKYLSDPAIQGTGWNTRICSHRDILEDSLWDRGTLIPVKNSNGAVLSWLFSE